MAGKWRVTDLAELISGTETAIPGWVVFFLWPDAGISSEFTPTHVPVASLFISSRWAISLFPIVLVIASRIRDIFLWYTAEDPLDINSEPEVELTSWNINFPPDTNGNGFVFEFEGSKPPGTFTFT